MAFLNLDISRVDTADIRCWMKGRFTKNSGVYQSDSVTMTLKERYSVESGGIYTFELSDANVYLSIVEYDSSYQYVGVVEVYSGGAYSPSNGVEYVAVNIEWEPGYVSSAQELFDNGLIINIAKEEKAELPTQNDYTETLAEIRKEINGLNTGVTNLSGDVRVILVFVVITFCWSCMRQWRKNILKLGE